MKNYCTYCKYRDLGLHKEPCNSCWTFDGHKGHYTKYERGESLQSEVECDDDYCEIEVKEEK